ncbi:MAG: carboxymuconolactone decarboxylase family protein [Actinomycetota bacterium]|nr:carboxymuconolactone decarboxylase family protein [Actinomycetota bacterium]
MTDRVTSAPAPPRISPLGAGDWGPETLEALEFGRDSLLADALREALAERDRDRLGAILPNGITGLLHHPRLTGRYLAFNGALLTDAALPPRWRELLVLRVAWRTGSQYEWLQHVRMAPRYDLTAEQIEAVARGEGVWEEPEGDLIAAADQLMDHYRVDDATWARLADHLDTRQLIEVPFVVGAYTLLAMAYLSFDLPVDESLRGVDPIVSPEQRSH